MALMFTVKDESCQDAEERKETPTEEKIDGFKDKLSRVKELYKIWSVVGSYMTAVGMMIGPPVKWHG